MYSNNQSATDNQQQSPFGGPRGFRGCGGPGFGGKFGHRFGGGKGQWMKHFGGMFGQNRPSVNIEETDEAFTLHLYAAGLSKEAIKLSVKDDVLTIAYSAPETDEQTDKFSHREYTSGSFERLFQLNDKVLTGQISAAYNDGILKVTLPKDPETNKPAQQVNVN
jgi:HSP20 family protein